LVTAGVDEQTGDVDHGRRADRIGSADSKAILQRAILEIVAVSPPLLRMMAEYNGVGDQGDEVRVACNG
jgi:hypothetical protein